MEIRKELKYRKVNQDFALRNLPLEMTPEVCNTDRYFITSPEGVKTLIDPLAIAKIFMSGTLLSNLRTFYKVDQIYLYDKSCGVYRLLPRLAMDVIIRRVAEGAQLSFNKNLRNRVYEELKSLSTDLPVPVEDNVLIMTNGTLDLDTLTLSPWSPDNFAINQIPYDFVPGAPCEKFLEFLKESFPDEEMVPFIRAFLWAVINRHIESQIFVYLLGKGGTGKSTFANVCKALLGESMVLTTTLRDLHNDKFESLNLIGKRLILVSDTEHYQGDLSVLKSISGGDSLQGRIKHASGAYEVHPEGLVLITGNTPLGSRDSGGSISRRARVVNMNVKPKVVKDLLFYKPRKGWQGPLSPELNGIFYWAATTPPKESIHYLSNSSEIIPSMKEQLLITQAELNPVVAWFRDSVIKGKGAYIGLQNNLTQEKMILEVSKRGTLYPSYLIYMKQRGLQPINHVRFLRELKSVCENEGFEFIKERRKEGNFLRGLELKQGTMELDTLMGGPLLSVPTTSFDAGEPLRPSLDVEDPRMVNPAEEENKASEGQRGALRENLYSSYFQALGKTPLKFIINKKSRERALGLEASTYASKRLKSLSHLKSLDDFGQQRPVPTKVYWDRQVLLIQRGIDIIKKHGIIPYKYKHMGQSPRILPQNYGQTINNTSKDLRFDVYSKMSKDILQEGFVMVDFDLKSCYTTILLGLYPERMSYIQGVIEGQGLWKFIESEFIRLNKGNLYNKPAVKICTYSSFFLGGKKAMSTGVMEFFRKELGMLPQEFRDCEMYEGLYNLAQDITKVMSESNIIKDFKEISRYLYETYKGSKMVGPTGHSYSVESTDDFKTAYPNFLQSYEFAILAEATLRLIDQSPGIQVAGHYHDGNVLILPKEEHSQLIKAFQGHVYQVGSELGLVYPQSLEFKVIVPSDSLT